MESTHTQPHTHLVATEDGYYKGERVEWTGECTPCLEAYASTWLQPATLAQEAWAAVLRADRMNTIVSSERVELEHPYATNAPPLIVVTGPTVKVNTETRSDIEILRSSSTYTPTHLHSKSVKPVARPRAAPRDGAEGDVGTKPKKTLNEALMTEKEIEAHTIRQEAIERADEEAFEQIADIVGNIPLLEVPELANTRNIDDNKFRLNNQRVLVTYAKSDLKKKALKEFFCSKSKKPNLPCKVKIARETHKDGTKHMHVLVDFGYRFQSTSHRIFDYDGRHPNIKPIQNPIHWVNALCYLGKEDKSCTPHPNVVAAAKAWNCKNEGEAFVSGACSRPSDSIALFSMKPSLASDVEVPAPTAPWFHETLLPLLENKNYRSWYWFCDFEGNTQKSWACKHLFSKYCSGEDLDVLYLDLDCSLDNLCNLLVDAQKEGWTGKALLTDLPYSYADEKQFYTNLEKISNGFGTTGKYKGGRFLLRNNPIVVVFANWWPMLYDKKGTKTASADRWKFYYIERSLSAVCMNLNEVTAARRTNDEERQVECVAKAIVNKRVAEEKADEIKPAPAEVRDYSKYRRT